jgi:hypothetical protein
VVRFGKSKKGVTVLEAYFDESGTHGEQSGAVTVAGFVAASEQWTAFASEWKDFLLKEGITLFHRTDLEFFTGEFKREKGWDEHRRDRIVSEAQHVISKHVHLGFAHSVIKVHYDEVVTGEARQRLGAQHYTFCAQACMRKIAAWAQQESHKEAITYVFEAGAKGTGQLTQMMGKVSKSRRGRADFRLGSLSVAKKYDEVIEGVLFPGVIPLQAADILAYEVYKLMDNWFVAEPKRPMRKSMIRLLNLPIRLEMTHHDEVELLHLIERVETGDLPYV